MRRAHAIRLRAQARWDGLALIGPGLRLLGLSWPGRKPRRNLNTTTANGRLVFGIFAALAEFEYELIIERTRAGLASARAWSRNGGQPFKTTPAKLCLAQAAMGQSGTKVGELCAELGVSRQTLYRHVDPKGQLRPDGAKSLRRRGRFPAPDGAPTPDTAPA